MSKESNYRIILGFVFVVTIFVAFLVGALLVNIEHRKSEGENKVVRLTDVTEDTTDASIWGQNWPLQYDLYKKTALRTHTRFGGHGGSEDLPRQKLDMYPFLRTVYQGYAFAIDYRERRGHQYMLIDQEQTKRQTVPQTGSCLHCHATVIPFYKHIGNGDVFAGFEKSYKLSFKEASETLHKIGHAFPLSCVDCHDPKTMNLRVTRPAFIQGIQRFANSDADVPFLPSIKIFRDGKRSEPYNPNTQASRNEMRSFVCAQCHTEYYCSAKMPLEVPWGKGLGVENIEAYWNEKKFPDGDNFYDFEHKLTGAKVLKAQHPDFEVWSQGVHARAGVACADCHMPYIRTGASKVSDHWVRSPLLNINRACQVCHFFPEKELEERVNGIQDKNCELLKDAGRAVEDLIKEIAKARESGATEKELEKSFQCQRKAQWYLDFAMSENSMGFHAPQEMARILARSSDIARQGQIEAIKFKENKEP